MLIYFTVEMIFSFIINFYIQNQNIKNLHLRKVKSSLCQKNDLLLKKSSSINKSHSPVKVFDWMMEMSYLMKLNRTTFYRACNIFYQCYKKDSRVLQNSNVEKYASASLVISAKLQKSTVNYLQQIFEVNLRRIPKQLINATQISICKLLNWNIPLMNLISQQTIQVIKKWNNYLEKCHKMNLVRKQTCERLRLNLQYSQNQPLKNKTYSQIIYATDILVLNQAKKYFNSTFYQSGPSSYITPIAVSLYTVLTIHQGDSYNLQKHLFPLFKNFYRQGLERTASEIDRLQKQIDVSFILYNVPEHIRKMPLDKEWKQAMNSDLQIYSPVNVIDKKQAI